MKYIKYLWYILNHKFWVLYYCRINNITWQGITHDMSKLSIREFIFYVEKFYGKKKDIKSDRNKSGHYNPLDDASFKVAWFWHSKRNEHHWQYWTVSHEDGTFRCIDMPDKYLTEMICDWLGASRALGNNKPDRHITFYDNNSDTMHFTNKTRQQLEHILANDVIKLRRI